MGRPGASILLAFLLPTVAAVSTPDDQGDVSNYQAGQVILVDAPYIDILNVTMDQDGDELVLAMQLASRVTSRPADVQLQFLFIFTFEGDDSVSLYQQETHTILCTFETSIGCRDTRQEFEVALAGVNGEHVTSRLRHVAPAGTWLIGGASSQTQDGNVTAQDFTPNALPFQGGAEPSPTLTDGIAPTPWWKTWRIYALLAAVALVGGYTWKRLRP